MKQCKSYKKYKGILPPKCNNGNPCDACISKYTKHLTKKWTGLLEQRNNIANIIESREKIIMLEAWDGTKV